MANRASEFALIETLFRPLSEGFPGALGLKDDAALLSADEELAVTQDGLVAGVHFPLDETPEAIAAKALRVNLSDLAAMGAAPLAYLLTLALPDEIDGTWLRRFCASLGEEQGRWGIMLAGGDTVSTPGPLMLSITALGTVPVGAALRRSGARPGDSVYVSGTIGDGVLGLAVLRGELSAAGCGSLVERLRLPTPRVALGRALIGVASACADISDGLVADTGHIAEASGVAIAIDAAAVPLSDAAKAVVAEEPAWFPRMLTGGDDYELVFTAGEAVAEGIPIGSVEPGRGVTVLAADGTPMTFDDCGYRHF
ncbi:MAG: thiamine-phosphate kinase [Alphaproteobacteria bacterium]|mgnify:CR=1 FL=1|jgi:thiamine-monophosphate kinase|nr:thiamine-phosphate kinase [Alphaproteobacteria bacterium]MDP6237589.1 thiamine-phosphate kinase [Alphaproteobacteria bacterium]MDP7172987.1 thiamine-phosphate kinase [Alphaproteobacteria bacterium]MDP7488416.1 thiamine-phosphate kinase [Alphaproteobacteria bacterium]HJN20661.1 thiamine-phosphate kinase [Alphaproteobacteria bacterium]|tara:strand:+ start:2998 stop:3930 length:933 start_codon:yes stop_codon:yes gene_type:complete